jgi:hypothetical protein
MLCRAIPSSFTFEMPYALLVIRDSKIERMTAFGGRGNLAEEGRDAADTHLATVPFSRCPAQAAWDKQSKRDRHHCDCQVLTSLGPKHQLWRPSPIFHDWFATDQVWSLPPHTTTQQRIKSHPYFITSSLRIAKEYRPRTVPPRTLVR